MPTWCTEMDRLGRLLIDACRQGEEVMDCIGNPSELSYSGDIVAQINAMISEHRNACVICRMVDYRLRTGQPLDESPLM